MRDCSDTLPMPLSAATMLESSSAVRTLLSSLNPRQLKNRRAYLISGHKNPRHAQRVDVAADCAAADLEFLRQLRRGHAAVLKQRGKYSEQTIKFQLS
jgi:hypothetical protein